AFYIETGDTYGGYGAKSLAQAINGGNPNWLGGGVVAHTAPPLSTWDTAPVKYSFVLFKKPTGTDSEGNDTSIEPWQLVLKDERSGINITNNSFVHLSRSKPVLPA